MRGRNNVSDSPGGKTLPAFSCCSSQSLEPSSNSRKNMGMNVNNSSHMSPRYIFDIDFEDKEAYPLPMHIQAYNSPEKIM